MYVRIIMWFRSIFSVHGSQQHVYAQSIHQPPAGITLCGW